MKIWDKIPVVGSWIKAKEDKRKLAFDALFNLHRIKANEYHSVNQVSDDIIAIFNYVVATAIQSGVTRKNIKNSNAEIYEVNNDAFRCWFDTTNNKVSDNLSNIIADGYTGTLIKETGYKLYSIYNNQTVKIDKVEYPCKSILKAKLNSEDSKFVAKKLKEQKKKLAAQNKAQEKEAIKAKEKLEEQKRKNATNLKKLRDSAHLK